MRKYIESDLADAINIDAALSLGHDMLTTNKVFRCVDGVLEIDDVQKLPTKYHNLMVDFNDLSEAAQDKIKPLEVV